MKRIKKSIRLIGLILVCVLYLGVLKYSCVFAQAKASGFSSSNIKEAQEASRNDSKKQSSIEIVGEKDKLLLKQKKKINKKDPSQEDYYSVSSKSYTQTDLDKADALAVKTISSIKSLLSNKKILTVSKEFELLLRLGELYSERHDYLRDKEIYEFETKYDTWAAKGSKGKAPVASYAGSTKQLKNSVSTFKKLVSDKKFSKEKRMDSALFALGKSLSRLNDDSAIKYFTQLVQNYPKSDLVAESYLAMGDFYFEKNSPDKALGCYQKVFKYKSHKVYPYAVYKSGWCYFNLNVSTEKEHKKNLYKAVNSFKIVVSLSDKNTNKAGRIDLKSEAMSDLAMVWADLEETKEAEKYFKRMKEDRAYYTMLEKLASIYVDQGKYLQAIKLYEKMLSSTQLYKTDPTYSLLLVSLYEQTTKLSSVTKELERYSQEYLNKNSKWYKKFQNDKVATHVEKDYEYALRKYATTFHKRFQKTSSKQYGMVSLNIYSMYLKDFSANPNAYTMRYYQSELYYDLKSYQESAKGYMNVAVDKSQSKYRQDAYLNTVYSYNEFDASQKPYKLPPLGKATSVVKIPEYKQNLITSIDTYASKYPKDKRSYPMMFTAANIYFTHGYYDEALKRFNNIIAIASGSKQAQISIKIIASYYSEKKDWDSLETFARSIRSNKAIDKKAIGSYIDSNIKLASFYKAQDLEKNKEYLKAAAQYKLYQSEFPSDQNAQRAMYNAAICYYKASDIISSISTQEQFLKTYPNSPLRQNVILELAQIYEAQAKYDKAASAYELFYKENSKDRRAISSLYNAATLYTGLKQYSKAEHLYRVVCDRTTDSKMKNQALLQIAIIQERASKYKEAYESYSRLSKIQSSIEDRLYAEAKALDINYTHKINTSKSTELSALKKKLLSGEVQAYEARNVVSKHLFAASEKLYSDFVNYKISDVEKIEKQVSTKQQKLLKAASAYEDIIKIKDPEYSVASYYVLGDMHEQFALGLSNISFPSNYSKEEISTLKTELHKVSSPLKEQSVKFFELAYSGSMDLDTFSGWSKKTYDKLAELNPTKYPNVEEESIDPSFLSFDIDAGTASKL